MALVTFTDKGLYCPQADVYIDPWRGVHKAIITHAHSDHARWGSRHYLCHTTSLPLLQLRLGAHNSFETLEWGQTITMNGVQISLHPAGHIIGSSMVRLAYKGEVWVFTGDYKLENDGLSGSWAPVPCHTLITECTFGLPIYTWQPQENVYADMRQWVQHNTTLGKSSVLTAYSLGKAQRVLQALAPLEQPIWVHGAIWNVHQTLLAAGHALPPVQRVMPDTPKQALKGAIVVAPPSADGTPWMKKFGPSATGICSGWMQVRGNARRRNADRGFVLSDHCDWPALLQAIEACQPQQVYTTHGYAAAFARYLTESGLPAAEVKTEYGSEEEDPLPPDAPDVATAEAIPASPAATQPFSTPS